MGSIFKSSDKVVFIGAAGGMCRLAIERFASASSATLVLTDINLAKLEPLVAKLPKGRATTKELDLFDPKALREIIQGASLVVLGAGPYMHTAEPVMKACIDVKVPYLDYDDDVESTNAALALNAEAKKAGVACYIGCGASPGMTNVMAVDVAQEVDTVDQIDICWLVGDERMSGMGRAVLEHLLHVAAGPCLTWADGKPTMHETWVEQDFAPMVGPVTSEKLLREAAHPEPVTLPRIFPKATRIRCMGALDPAPFNGLSRGVAMAVRRGALAYEDALSFLDHFFNRPITTQGITRGFAPLTGQLRNGNIKVNELLQLVSYAWSATDPWRYALLGMIDQIRSGECTIGEVLSFIIDAARGKVAAEYRLGILVRVVGMKDGHPTIAMKRTPKHGCATYLYKTMASITGTCCAAFMLMAVEQGQTHAGVLCPEDWAEPSQFYKSLQRMGVPDDELFQRL